MYQKRRPQQGCKLAHDKASYESFLSKASIVLK